MKIATSLSDRSPLERFHHSMEMLKEKGLVSDTLVLKRHFITVPFSLEKHKEMYDSKLHGGETFDKEGNCRSSGFTHPDMPALGFYSLPWAYCHLCLTCGKGSATKPGGENTNKEPTHGIFIQPKLSWETPTEEGPAEGFDMASLYRYQFRSGAVCDGSSVLLRDGIVDEGKPDQACHIDALRNGYLVVDENVELKEFVEALDLAGQILNKLLSSKLFNQKDLLPEGHKQHLGMAKFAINKSVAYLSEEN
jgi:hypothetical protein